MSKKHGLGRGLDALLPEVTGGGEQQVLQLPLMDIDPNPEQPRRSFDQEALEQLAQSMREQGVLQPLLVTEQGGRYSLVAGERRWRAARLAGLDSVPCLVLQLEPRQRQEIALVENLQREDLNPMEAAHGIRSLMDQCGLTQEQAAERLGKSRPAVANLLRLLNLPPQLQQLVAQGQLSEGHAKVLAGIAQPDTQLTLGMKAAEEGWSVRKLEEEAQAAAAAPQRRSPIRRVLTPELAALEDRLRESTGMRAVLSGTEKKGRIVLQYYSREELERLYELLERLEAL